MVANPHAQCRCVSSVTTEARLAPHRHFSTPCGHGSHSFGRCDTYLWSPSPVVISDLTRRGGPILRTDRAAA